MDLLSRLEHALEHLVEGVFSRAFRAPLQPIEIAKRLTREVEQHRAVSVNTTYVPNLYTVHLAPATFAGLQLISGRLLGELEQFLREFTVERHYETIGPIAVRLLEDAEMKADEMQVTAINDAAATPSVPAPSTLRADAPATSRHGAAFTPDMNHTTLISAASITTLEVVAGESRGRTLTLTDGLTLGRGPENTLPLTEMGISRHHAEIVWTDDAWMLRDLGSTNGTFVNGRRITTHALQADDTIRIGGTVMKVR